MAFAVLEKGASGKGIYARSEEAPSFLVPDDILFRHKLAPGDELGEDLFRELQSESERFFCREQALRYLALREHSSHELQIKLQTKNYGKAVAREVAAGLEDEGLLSDSRYAATVADSRHRRGEGNILIEKRLSAAGVDRSTIYDALSDDEEALQVSLRKAVKKYKVKSPEGDAKIVAYLVGKGFSGERARRALKALNQ